MSPSGLLGSLAYKEDGEAMQVCPVDAHTLRRVQPPVLGLGRILHLSGCLVRVCAFPKRHETKELLLGFVFSPATES